MPNLRVLDFEKVRKKERESSLLFEEEFKKLSQTQLDNMKPLDENVDRNAKIIYAINHAKSLEEVNDLEEALKMGKFDEYFGEKMKEEKKK